MNDLGGPILEWDRIVTNLAYVGAAYLLALPVAWDREQESRSKGLVHGSIRARMTAPSK